MTNVNVIKAQLYVSVTKPVKCQNNIDVVLRLAQSTGMQIHEVNTEVVMSYLVRSNLDACRLGLKQSVDSKNTAQLQRADLQLIAPWYLIMPCIL